MKRGKGRPSRRNQQRRRPQTERGPGPQKRGPGPSNVVATGAEPASAARFAAIAFNDVPRIAAGVLLLAALVINVANVVGRYGFGRSIYWADEAMVFLVVWSVCLGGVSVAWRGAHLNMDLLVEAFPRPLRAATSALVSLVTVMMFAGMAWIAATIVGKFAATGQRSVAIGVPMAIPHLALLLGFGLSALAIVLRHVIEGRLVHDRTVEERLETAI